MRESRSLRDALRTSWFGAILAEHDTEPTELMGGLLKIVVGVWLLLPWDTFASSSTFRVIGVAPEWAWGTVLFLVGSGHLVVLRDGSRTGRRRASLIGFLFWFSLGSVFVFSNPPALGWLLFMMSALGQGWAWIRLGRRT